MKTLAFIVGLFFALAPAAYSQLRIKDLAKDRAEEIMEDSIRVE